MIRAKSFGNVFLTETETDEDLVFVGRASDPGKSVKVNDTVTSPDGALKVTITAFDPSGGEGRLKIEELKAERGRFYVTVTYGEAGKTRIDYKTYDLKKASEYPFTTNRNDAIKEIKIVRVPAD